MSEIKYLRPASMEEASALLIKHGAEAKLLAGGTDLLLQLRNNLIKPRYLIDIGFLPELSSIAQNEDRINIGAAVKIAEIENSEVVRSQLPALASAARVLASHQVRNLATLGGNLCNAAPSADTAPALMAFGAEVSIYSPQGIRKMLLEDFFAGPGKTILKQGEILIGVTVPLPAQGSKCIYLKHTLKRSMDIAIVGVAVKIDWVEQTCQNVGLVLGAVAPTPIRIKQAEAMINGSKLDQETVIGAAEAAALQCQPITDIRCSGDYRRLMVKVLTTRALEMLKNGVTEN